MNVENVEVRVSSASSEEGPDVSQDVGETLPAGPEDTGADAFSDVIPSAYEITGGDTGKRILLSDSQKLEDMGAYLKSMLILKEESLNSDAERPVGYFYRIRVLDEKGEVFQNILLNGNYAEIDDRYNVAESANLIAYLDELFSETFSDGQPLSFEFSGGAGGREFILYLPETPVESLTQDCLSWWPGRYQSGTRDRLNCFCLYNVNTGQEFFTAG